MGAKVFFFSFYIIPDLTEDRLPMMCKKFTQVHANAILLKAYQIKMMVGLVPLEPTIPGASQIITTSH